MIQYHAPDSMPSAKSRSAWLWARCAISCPSIMRIANGHSMTSTAAITTRPAYQPRRGCGRWVAPGERGLDVLRRRVAVWRRFCRGFVSTTLTAFISPTARPRFRRSSRPLPFDSPITGAVLRGDPTAHVLGAVDDLCARHFDAREKSHRVTIDECDVLQIENDAIARRSRQQLLQPRRVLDVEHPAQDEHARAGLCGLVDSIRHSRAPPVPR